MLLYLANLFSYESFYKDLHHLKLRADFQERILFQFKPESLLFKKICTIHLLLLYLIVPHLYWFLTSLLCFMLFTCLIESASLWIISVKWSLDFWIENHSFKVIFKSDALNILRIIVGAHLVNLFLIYYIYLK